MTIKKLYIFALIAIIFTSIPQGCSRKNNEFKSRYSRIVEEITDLYSSVNPLIASEMGLSSADRNLLVFDRVEIDSILQRTKHIRKDIESLKNLNFDEYYADNLIIAQLWLKGLEYSLEKLKSYSFSPVLYTWSIERALFSIQSAKRANIKVKCEDFLSRISKIDNLVNNATSNLIKTGSVELEVAIEMLDSLLSRENQLKNTLKEKYDKFPVDSLKKAFESIRSLKTRFEKLLKEEPKNRNILGMEELSRVFIYDEYINVAPNSLVRDGEKMIRILRVKRNSLEQKLLFKKRSGKRNKYNQEVVNSQKPGKSNRRKIEEGILSQSGKLISGQIEDEGLLKLHNLCNNLLRKPFERKGIRYDFTISNYPVNQTLTKNPMLTIQYPDKETIQAIPPLATRTNTNKVRVIYSSVNGKADRMDLIYKLISVLPQALLPDIKLYSRNDTLRTLLRSQTYRYMWYFSQMERMIRGFPVLKDTLSVMLLNEKIRSLARMVITIELCSGLTTIEEARERYIDLTGANEQEATMEAVLASIFPSCAYKGVSLIISDRLFRLLSSKINLGNTEKEFNEALKKYPYLPAMMILEKCKE